jgi:signal transduction histidine kinase
MNLPGHSKVLRPAPGLRPKISLLLLAIQVPALVILAFETSRGVRDLFREMGTSQAYRVVKELNRRLADLEDPEEYQDVLASFFDSAKGMKAAVSVFLAEGGQLRVRASWGRQVRVDPGPDDVKAFDGTPVEQSLEGPDSQILIIHYPFRGADDSVIGVIRLDLDGTENALRVGDSNRQLFVGMVVIFALSVAVLFIGMHLLVVAPVKSLAEAMGRAREGRLEAVSVGASHDEIGWLGRSYNGMVGRLRALLDEKESLLGEVRDLNQNLQARIEEATRDLAMSHKDLQKAYHDLYASQRELARLERLASLGQVAREIAHEFATPLNVISGTLQMLLEDPALKPEHRERLGRVLAQTERLIQTSRDTLSPLKMPAPELRPGDLNHLVREVAAFMAPAFAARRVEFRARLDPKIPPVRADLHQIEQVLLNLISNALDAMPGGGRIAVDTGVDPPADPSAGPPSVVFRVRDDGVGIPPEHLAHIFDPFFSTKGAGRGTGLGLAICKEIIAQHRGEIRIKSTPGQGSLVVVRLPAAASLTAGPAAGEGSPEAAA